MKEFKKYANSFQEKSKLGLESIGILLSKLDNPHKGGRFIHIAGTNGKGSVCAFLQNILTCAGLKTGKFISPNMIEVYERISVDGKNISPRDMDRLLTLVGEKAEEMEHEIGVMPTQFEIWTAAAFLYFKEQNCDIVVLETGLGGRLDATNIIDNPLCSVITRVDMDHTEYLGDTLPKITYEKAGIIKENCPVITLSDQGAQNVIENRAKETRSDIYLADKPKNITYENGKEYFDYKELKGLEINLLGLHQVENATLALETGHLLKIDEKYIREGLKKARNIGRFEKISENPMIFFDGAHNACGMRTLVDCVKRYLPKKNISIVFGAMRDKEIDEIITLIKQEINVKNVYTVEVKDNPRAETAQNLCERFVSYGFNAEPCENISAAIKKATSAGDVTLICGSLYLYKDLKENA